MGLLAALGFLALICVLDQFGAFAGIGGYAGNDLRFDQRKYRFARMADRRCVVLSSATRSIKVHLLGVAQTSDHAGDYLAARCAGREVLLKMDEGRTRDEQMVLVGYLYVDEGCLNQELIAKGLAATDRVPHALRKAFEQAEATARKKKLGMWGAVSKQ